MISESQIFGICCVIIMVQIWKNVLKKGAYPDAIPLEVKLPHACILLLVMIVAIYSFLYMLLWMVSHPGEVMACLKSEPNKIGSIPACVAGLLQGICGTILLRVGYKLLKRNKNGLRLYFILWPITFLSSAYVLLNHDLFRPQLMVPVVVFCLVIVGALAVTLAFYLGYSASLIFGEKGSGNQINRAT